MGGGGGGGKKGGGGGGGGGIHGTVFYPGIFFEFLDLGNAISSILR